MPKSDKDVKVYTARISSVVRIEVSKGGYSGAQSVLKALREKPLKATLSTDRVKGTAKVTKVSSSFITRAPS